MSKKPKGHYTASGKMLLPEKVTVDIRPSEKVKGKYDLSYSETLPTVDKTIIERTLSLLGSTFAVSSIVKGKKDTTISVKATLTHDEVGGGVAMEFLAWSLIGKLSLTDLLMAITFKSVGHVEVADALLGKKHGPAPVPFVTPELMADMTIKGWDADYEVKS